MSQEIHAQTFDFGRGYVFIGSSIFAELGCKTIRGQQGRIIGTVDGLPLIERGLDRTIAIAAFRSQHSRPPEGPADQAEVDGFLARSQCLTITSAITGAARTAQIRHFKISWTTAEAEALRAEYLRLHDPETGLKKQQDDMSALATALAEVYEHGMDQQQAYEKYMALPQLPAAELAGDARTANGPGKRGRRWRSGLPSRQTPCAVPTRPASADCWSGTSWMTRLTGASPQLIPVPRVSRRAEPRDHREVTVGNPVLGDGASAHMNYLQVKRAEWWQAQREAEALFVINDPVLAKQCGIGADGRPLPGQVKTPPVPRRPSGPPPGSEVPFTITPILPQK